MTRSQLEEYSDIVAEIKDLEARLNSPVFDVVSVSQQNFPYTKGKSQVRGVPGAALYRKRLESLKEHKLAIERFIDALPTSRQRRVVRLKVMDALSWNDIAAKMGYMHSVDSLRKCYTRAVDNSIRLQAELREKSDRLEGHYEV